MINLNAGPEKTVRQIQHLALFHRNCITGIARPQFYLNTFSNMNFAKPPLICFCRP